MEHTTSRLRKTFHYPTENDSDDSLPEALDEEGMFEPRHLPHAIHPCIHPSRRLTPLPYRTRESHPAPHNTPHKIQHPLHPNPPLSPTHKHNPLLPYPLQRNHFSPQHLIHHVSSIYRISRLHITSRENRDFHTRQLEPANERLRSVENKSHRSRQRAAGNLPPNAQSRAQLCPRNPRGSHQIQTPIQSVQCSRGCRSGYILDGLRMAASRHLSRRPPREDRNGKRGPGRGIGKSEI